MHGTYTQVGDDFSLHVEILVVVSEADGDVEPLAQLFFRPQDGGHSVTEQGPLPVIEILEIADAEADRSGKQVMVQLDGDAIWHPMWGTLA
jgi:hypothetical protein